jgi:hypothetical protein
MRHPWRENSRLGREALKTAADMCADCVSQQMLGLCKDEYKHRYMKLILENHWIYSTPLPPPQRGIFHCEIYKCRTAPVDTATVDPTKVDNGSSIQPHTQPLKNHSFPLTCREKQVFLRMAPGVWISILVLMFRTVGYTYLNNAEGYRHLGTWEPSTVSDVMIQISKCASVRKRECVFSSGTTSHHLDSLLNFR